MKTLFEDSFGKIYIDGDVIYGEWTGFLKLEKLRPAAEILIKAVADHRITKHVSHHKDLKILSHDVVEFLGTRVMPGLAKAGIKKMAAIVSDNVFAEMSAKNVTKNTTAGLETQYFSNLHDAKNWLV